jgi:hypothetical protein
MSDIENRVKIQPKFGSKTKFVLEHKGQYVELPKEMGESLSKELEVKREDKDREYYELRHMKEGIDALLWTLASLHPEVFGTEKAVEELYKWKPECFQAGVDFKESGYYSDGDEDCPFFSEKFLYNLLGKGDARSLLGMLDRALGFRGRK